MVGSLRGERFDVRSDAEVGVSCAAAGRQQMTRLAATTRRARAMGTIFGTPMAALSVRATAFFSVESINKLLDSESVEDKKGDRFRAQSLRGAANKILILEGFVHLYVQTKTPTSGPPATKEHSKPI